MRRVVQIALLLSLFTTISLAQDAKPAPAPGPQQREKAGSDDTVYKEDDVDVKAKLKLHTKEKVKIVVNNSPYRFTSDCPAQGQATLTAVIHKSGKVTEVTLAKGSGCNSFDKAAIERARKLKFIPALKDGRAVSQESEIKTSYVRP